MLCAHTVRILGWATVVWFRSESNSVQQPKITHAVSCKPGSGSQALIFRLVCVACHSVQEDHIMAVFSVL
jgi:hypothetical protein